VLIFTTSYKINAAEPTPCGSDSEKSKVGIISIFGQERYHILVGNIGRKYVSFARFSRFYLNLMV
jgi:hypothetical protein